MACDPCPVVAFGRPVLACTRPRCPSLARGSVKRQAGLLLELWGHTLVGNIAETIMNVRPDAINPICCFSISSYSPSSHVANLLIV
jgi:hypothetical protein